MVVGCYAQCDPTQPPLEVMNPVSGPFTLSANTPYSFPMPITLDADWQFQFSTNSRLTYTTPDSIAAPANPAFHVPSGVASCAELIFVDGVAALTLPSGTLVSVVFIL